MTNTVRSVTASKLPDGKWEIIVCNEHNQQWKTITEVDYVGGIIWVWCVRDELSQNRDWERITQ